MLPDLATPTLFYISMLPLQPPECRETALACTSVRRQTQRAWPLQSDSSPAQFSIRLALLCFLSIFIYSLNKSLAESRASSVATQDEALVCFAHNTGLPSKEQANHRGVLLMPMSMLLAMLLWPQLVAAASWWLLTYFSGG